MPFACSRNQWRSPTAEQVWRRHPAVSVRSAGTSPNARRTVSTGDLRWADVVFVMERSTGLDGWPITAGLCRASLSTRSTGGGKTLAAPQAELTGAGIAVTASSCWGDGMSRPAVCGMADGAVGIFVVPASKRAGAEALQFTPLGTTPATVRVACP